MPSEGSRGAPHSNTAKSSQQPQFPSSDFLDNLFGPGGENEDSNGNEQSEMEDEHGGNNRDQGEEEEGLDLENGDLNQDYAGEEGEKDPYGGNDNLQDSTSPQRKRKGVEE